MQTHLPLVASSAVVAALVVTVHLSAVDFRNGGLTDLGTGFSPITEDALHRATDVAFLTAVSAAIVQIGLLLVRRVTEPASPAALFRRLGLSTIAVTSIFLTEWIIGAIAGALAGVGTTVFATAVLFERGPSWDAAFVRAVAEAVALPVAVVLVVTLIDAQRLASLHGRGSDA